MYHQSLTTPNITRSDGDLLQTLELLEVNTYSLKNFKELLSKWKQLTTLQKHAVP